MTEHTGLPVAGYQKQSNASVEQVNRNKHKEEQILRVIDALRSGQTSEGESIEVDQRWLSIAQTDLEKGFMALNRAIFRPARIEGEI